MSGSRVSFKRLNIKDVGETGEYDDGPMVADASVRVRSRLYPLTEDREEERERSELSGVQ